MWQSETVNLLQNGKNLAFEEGSDPANEAKRRVLLTGRNTPVKGKASGRIRELASEAWRGFPKEDPSDERRA